MPEYELTIAVADEPGDLSVKEGDIVNVKPKGKIFGRQILDKKLIIPIRAKESFDELLRLRIPYFEGGLDEEPGLPDPDDLDG